MLVLGLRRRHGFWWPLEAGYSKIRISTRTKVTSGSSMKLRTLGQATSWKRASVSVFGVSRFGTSISDLDSMNLLMYEKNSCLPLFGNEFRSAGQENGLSTLSPLTERMRSPCVRGRFVWGQGTPPMNPENTFSNLKAFSPLLCRQ